MTTETIVQTDCCGDRNAYLIADTLGDGDRVRVEGTCPTCAMVNPLGRIVQSEAGEEG